MKNFEFFMTKHCLVEMMILILQTLKI